MGGIREQEIEIARRKNLIVYLSSIQDPYFFGDDNSKSRWTDADVGKFYALKALSVPLELRVEENDAFYYEPDKAKLAFQEYIKLELHNIIRSIEHYRKTRDDSVANLGSPYDIIETTPDDAEAYIHSVEFHDKALNVEGIIGASLVLGKDQDEDSREKLFDTIGSGVKRGANDYVLIKKIRAIGKRMPWKFHVEYDSVMLQLLEELIENKYLPAMPTAHKALLDTLTKEGYTREHNKERRTP